jgi:glycosyltransferase involved in cell wall biosynthesis
VKNEAMKVNYYFRNRNVRNNSFENLFEDIIHHLPAEFKTKKVTATQPFDWRLLWRARKEQADVHHITGAVNYLALSLPSEKTILTIHDLGFYENPVHNVLKRKLYGELWFRAPLRRSRYVTVVSEFTRQKLQEYFQIEEERIKVIPNPVLSHFTAQPLRLPSERLNILQIGSGDHKNLKGLIKAAEALPVHIIKVGYLGEEERTMLERSRVSYEVHTSISNEHVVNLYKKSDVLFFASLYEGFGMPIIEAQTVGKPVITSNVGAMKEVAGDAALLVTPTNIEEIRAAIVALHQQPDRYQTLVDKGKKNASRFSLIATVDKYAKLYRQINE